jgi:hypothetical protein
VQHAAQVSLPYACVGRKIPYWMCSKRYTTHQWCHPQVQSDLVKPIFVIQYFSQSDGDVRGGFFVQSTLNNLTPFVTSKNFGLSRVTEYQVDPEINRYEK